MNRSKSFLILLCALVILGSFSTASAEVGFNGIGGRVGFVDPEFVDETLTFGVVADLGTIVEQVAWDASLMYWASSDDIGPNANYKWTYSNMAIRTTVRYLFLTDKWRPYAGGGIGIHMFSWENAYSTYDGNDTEMGLHVVGGLETDLSARWKGMLDLQIDFVDVDQTTLQFTFMYALNK